MVAPLLDEYLVKETREPDTGQCETCADVHKKPYLKPYIFDGTHPLTDYFISSSHNTYLVANQLWGNSSPKSYTTALLGVPPTRPAARCVEIDVWYTKSGPVVTHGHTFTKSISFRGVCEAIGEAVKADDLPVTVSLECHVDYDKQPELVHIMKEVWGDKLVTERIHRNVAEVISDLIHHSHTPVTPDDLTGRIFLMVEWYPAKVSDLVKQGDEGGSSSSSSDSDFSDSEESQEMKKWRAAHPKNKTKIHPDLAALGVYANSIKPKGNWLSRDIEDPLHALINISESGLTEYLPVALADLVAHGSKYLRRCYPRGTRVQSTNMDPLPAWRAGTQVVALNMQVWDLGMQFNGALFEGTQGWVLKPEGLRGGPSRSEEKTFKLQVIGADDVPHPSNTKNLATYFKCDLCTPSERLKYKSKVVEDHGGDPFWDEAVEFKYEDGELIFVRLRLYQDRWGKDEEIATFTAQLDRLETGFRFWPLTDGEGNLTEGHILVRLF
ncbi:PLC-like phosphodiesterase [Daedaleopsis nitida]|nr:PLC-like phosphodiesterase [Daedaleopsis nitida]